MLVSKISIIIPCFNEEKSITHVLAVIDEVHFGNNILKEVIIVDDYSTDNTRKILKNLDKKKYQIIFQPQNMGKTDAVKLGILNSTGDVVVVQDADLEYDPADLSKLIRPFILGNADVVYGSRFKGDSPRLYPYALNYIANVGMTFLSNILNRMKLSDIHTCYIMIEGNLARELAQEITSKRFSFNPEVTARIGKRKGVRVFETGISYYGRTKAQGKKIKLKDAFEAVKDIVYYGLTVKRK